MKDIFYPTKATSILEIKDDVVSAFVRAVESIDGNRENFISYDPEDKSWYIEAINDCGDVNLGESDGLVRVSGKTLDEAIGKFESAVVCWNNNDL